MRQIVVYSPIVVGGKMASFFVLTAYVSVLYWFFEKNHNKWGSNENDIYESKRDF